MRILLLYAYITTAAGAGKQCNRPPGGPASCPAPPDAANNKNCAATSCPAPPHDRFKGKKKVKVGTFDPTDIPEPPRKPLRFLKLEDEDDEELELRLSAAEGRADAQYNLGVMFDGQGATADPQEAARLLRMGASVHTAASHPSQGAPAVSKHSRSVPRAHTSQNNQNNQNRLRHTIRTTACPGGPQTSKGSAGRPFDSGPRPQSRAPQSRSTPLAWRTRTLEGC